MLRTTYFQSEPGTKMRLWVLLDDIKIIYISRHSIFKQKHLQRKKVTPLSKKFLCNLILMPLATRSVLQEYDQNIGHRGTTEVSIHIF